MMPSGAINRFPVSRIGSVSLLSLLLAGGMAVAQEEGVPAGRVVFYPSVEVSYLSEDNVFLRNDAEPSPSPGVVESGQQYYQGDFRLELPFSRSRASLTYSPRYRDYTEDLASLPDRFSHYFDLASTLDFANGSLLRVDEKFARDNVTVREFAGSEVRFGTDTFTSNNFGVSLEVPLSPRHGIGGEVRSRILRFAEETAPSFFETTGLDLALRYRRAFSPVSEWTLDLEFGDTDQERNSVCNGICIVIPAEDYRTNGLAVGWKGTGDRRLNLDLHGGYRTLRFDASGESDFSGFVGEILLRYRLTSNTELRGQVSREAYASFFDSANFYVSDLLAVTFSREVGRRLSWNARAEYRRNEYQDPIQDVSGIFQPSLGLERSDRIATLEARLEYSFLRTLSAGAFLRYEESDSNVVAEVDLVRFPPFDYDAVRAGVQVRFGWD